MLFCRLLIFFKINFSRSTMVFTLCLLGNFACFFVVCWFFLKINFSRSTMVFTLCLLGNFARLFLSSADFFENQLFRNILSGIPSECQTVWIQIRPDILSGLIWVQTVCKGYQQMTLSRHWVNKTLKFWTLVACHKGLEQTVHFVGPDMCPNSLQRLSADDTSR